MNLQFRKKKKVSVEKPDNFITDKKRKQGTTSVNDVRTVYAHVVLWCAYVWEGMGVRACACTSNCARVQKGVRCPALSPSISLYPKVVFCHS